MRRERIIGTSSDAMVKPVLQPVPVPPLDEMGSAPTVAGAVVGEGWALRRRLEGAIERRRQDQRWTSGCHRELSATAPLRTGFRNAEAWRLPLPMSRSTPTSAANVRYGAPYRVGSGGGGDGAEVGSTVAEGGCERAPELGGRERGDVAIEHEIDQIVNPSAQSPAGVGVGGGVNVLGGMPHRREKRDVIRAIPRKVSEPLPAGSRGLARIVCQRRHRPSPARIVACRSVSSVRNQPNAGREWGVA